MTDNSAVQAVGTVFLGVVPDGASSPFPTGTVILSLVRLDLFASVSSLG